MSTQSPPMPGFLNGRRYKILQKIGDPTINEIYLAEDKRLKRQVAVKVIRTPKKPLLNGIFTEQGQNETLDKFKAEAEFVARFHDDHIVEIYDFGEDKEHGKDTLNYIVMPYYPEGSLYQWFQKRKRPLKDTEVAWILKQAGTCVQLIHDQGYVHRDIKPTNFLVKSTNVPSSPLTLVLADFGHVLPAGEDTDQDSKGTSYYMAPERWAKGLVICEIDQYALAIMAYYLLTGKHPFEGPSKKVRKQHIHMPPPPLREQGISPEVEAIVFKALAKQSEDRYHNVTDFIEAFSAACGEAELVLVAEHTGDTDSPEPEPPRSPIPITDRNKPSLPERFYRSIKTGRPKWARPIAITMALAIIAAPLWAALPHTLPAPSCYTTPFLITGSSSYPSLSLSTQTASDGEQIGLSVGAQFFDLTSNRDSKIKIANEIASGNSQSAQTDLNNLIIYDPNDAEARIYLEDQNILRSPQMAPHPYIAIVLGLEFSPSLKGETHDSLQAAYIAQQQWNQAASQVPGQPRLLLIVANAGDDSTPLNTQHVISQINNLHQKVPELIGIIGWEDSTRTYQAIQALGNQSISLISPSASEEDLSGLAENNFFFRVVPPDNYQASLAVNFALSQWPQAKNVAIFTIPGSSSTSIYPAGLASDWVQDLRYDHIKTTPQTYTFNQPQTIQTALDDALSTKPDLIFFSGYAGDLETLLEDQSRYPDPKLRNIPVVAGDAASTMSDYTSLPSGLDHTYFTSFASEKINLFADFFNSGFFTTYRQTFPYFASLTHVNDVDEDTILEYDAIEVLLHGYQYQKNSSGKITLSQALRAMGTCQGVSGQIAFNANGDPIHKYIVLEHVLVNENKLEVLDHSDNFY